MPAVPLADAVLGEGEAWLTELDDDALRELVTLRPVMPTNRIRWRSTLRCPRERPDRFGLTWWGQRWIEALEALGAVYANRLPRGRTYARKEMVQDLTVQAGAVTARVQDSRARLYRVQLQLPSFDDATREAITTALASRVRLSADLLAATMPEDIDDVLAECGVSLFPTARELTTRCSCPDVANPCKHVAAVHYVLAQTFDADPFLLTTLRGRDRDALLAGLRAQRAGTDLPERTVESTADPIPVDALVARDLYRAAGSLADIAVRPHRPDDPGAVLRRLGPPPGLEAASDELQAAVRGAAAVAWELLDSDTDPVTGALRRHGATSARQLAELLAEPMPNRSRRSARSCTASAERASSGSPDGDRQPATTTSRADVHAGERAVEGATQEVRR